MAARAARRRARRAAVTESSASAVVVVVVEVEAEAEVELVLLLLLLLLWSSDLRDRARTTADEEAVEVVEAPVPVLATVEVEGPAS
jgi:hypothetical protein